MGAPEVLAAPQCVKITAMFSTTKRKTARILALAALPMLLMLVINRVSQKSLYDQLTRAVISGQTGLANAALDRGADINNRRPRLGDPGCTNEIHYLYWSPVEYALRSPGNAAMVDLLLRRGAILDKEEALRTAVFESRLTIVQALLQHNARPRDKDVEGKTPLDHALEKRRGILNDIRRVGTRYANEPQHTNMGYSEPSPNQQVEALNAIIKLLKAQR